LKNEAIQTPDRATPLQERLFSLQTESQAKTEAVLQKDEHNRAWIEEKTMSTKKEVSGFADWLDNSTGKKYEIEYTAILDLDGNDSKPTECDVTMPDDMSVELYGDNWEDILETCINSAWDSIKRTL
jgi:hypothetical protein